MEVGWLWVVFLTSQFEFEALRSLFSSAQGSSLLNYIWGAIHQSWSDVPLVFHNQSQFPISRPSCCPESHILVFAPPVSREALSLQTDRGSIWPCHQEPCDSRWKNPQPSPHFQSSPHPHCLIFSQHHKSSTNSLCKGWKELLMGETAHLFFHP